MDWSLIIFIAVAVFFTYRGYQKGLIRSLSRLLSLLAGYIASILFIGPTSTIVASLFQLQGIVPFIIAALFLFIAGGVAVSFLFLLLGKMIPEQESTSTASSIGGAALGLGVGVVIAFVIVWTFAFVRDVRPAQQTDAITDTQKSSIENLTNRVAGKAVNSAMSMASADPEVTNLSTALVEAPAEVAFHAQRLANSNDLSALLGDSLNQSVVNSGDIAAVKKLPAFQKLVNNPDMQALAKSAGMTSESTDHATLETALAVQLVDITARVQRVQNNQRVQEILSDPEFQQKIQSNNPLELLTNSRLLELADIIFSDTAAPNNPANKETDANQTENNSPETPKQQTTIYSWTDKDGKIHYSDVEPQQ
jgi:uncharacterized membrane protein required for colicin V production